MAGGLPVGELLLVAGLAFVGDALLQGGGGFKLVAVGGAPCCGQLAFEGIFQQRLAIDLELFAGGFQAGHALIKFGKQFLDLGDNAVLFGGWRNGNFAGAEIRRRYPALPDRAGHVVLGDVAEGPAGNEVINELRADAGMRAQNVKLC